jgi:hypothetical protein
MYLPGGKNCYLALLVVLFSLCNCPWVLIFPFPPEEANSDLPGYFPKNTQLVRSTEETRASFVWLQSPCFLYTMLTKISNIFPVVIIATSTSFPSPNLL